MASSALTASGVASAALPEKASRMVSNVFSEVDALRGFTGTAQHAFVHVAFTSKEKAIHGYESARVDSEIPFRQKLSGCHSALLHAKSQKACCSLAVSDIFEQFDFKKIQAVVVRESFRFGEFHYVSSPVRALQVDRQDEKKLVIESIHQDLHTKHPAQLHTCFTFAEFKEFSSTGKLPTKKGQYNNFNLFTSIEEALTFHAYVSRDFIIEPGFNCLKTHDIYFMSFFMEDATRQWMLNTEKLTIFSRSGFSQMYKVNSDYFLSASELRLHEVSSMTFNTAAYWTAVQHTSWSDFHHIFNAVQSEFQALKQRVQLLNLPYGWFHMCQKSMDPSVMDIQEKASVLSYALCDGSFTEPGFEVRDRTKELDTSDVFSWHHFHELVRREFSKQFPDCSPLVFIGKLRVQNQTGSQQK